MTNGTGQTEGRAGRPAVDLAGARSPTRDQMDGYVSQGTGASLAAGRRPVLPRGQPEARRHRPVARLVPGQHRGHGTSSASTRSARSSVTAQATCWPSTRRCCRSGPGSRRPAWQRPLEIAWVWPLIDQPHHQVCIRADQQRPGHQPGAGRPAVGPARGRAGESWRAPDLGHRPGAAQRRGHDDQALPGGSGLRLQRPRPPSRPARRPDVARRAAGRSPSDQPTVLTPYANVDVSALVHSGLAADITSAYSMGYAVADSVLHGSFGPTIAVPAGGTADLSVLTNLATAQHIGTVVLDSSEMPPANPAGFEPDDAVTSIRTAGRPDHDRPARRPRADRGAGGGRHQLRRPAAEHAVRGQPAVPGRDRDDRRRGAGFGPLHRGGPAGGLEPVGRAGQRTAQRDRPAPRGWPRPRWAAWPGARTATPRSPASPRRPTRTAPASSAAAT